MAEKFKSLTNVCHRSCQHSSCYYGVLSGLRNGLVYGARIRFPHALVMTVLFRYDRPIMESVKWILRATFEHARTLGIYAAFYKAVSCMIRHLRDNDADDRLGSLVAGAIGGYVIFGNSTAVIQQINLYVFSRVAVALTTLAQEPPNTLPEWFPGYQIFASVVWALVMYLFEKHPSHVVPGMRASMEYLYTYESLTEPPIVPFRRFVNSFNGRGGRVAASAPRPSTPTDSV